MQLSGSARPPYFVREAWLQSNPSPRLFREVVVTKLSAVMAAVFCCLAVIDEKVTLFEKELVHLPDLPFFIGLVSRFLKPKRQQTW